MSLELVAGLLGSQLVRAVATEVVTNLAAQMVQHAVTSAVTPTREARPTVVVAPATVDPAPPLRALPTVEIVSATPGRARLRVQGLRGDALRAEELSARLRALAGVTTVEAKVVTGTLLVRFDPRRVTLPEIRAALEPRMAERPRRPSSTRPLLRVVGD